MTELTRLYMHYMHTGGITMYPLMLCCLAMWGLIFFYLPVWQPPVQREVKQLTSSFDRLRSNSQRHNKQLYDYLLHRCRARLGRGVSTIKIFATLAPFLGLFGTVTGMIKTFQSVATFGLANPKALAGGISEAMITTQFGLLIALPGIFAVYFFNRHLQRKTARIRQMTTQLVQKSGRRVPCDG